MSVAREFDINVLAEVFARPILWDSGNEIHKESDKKPAEWLAIADKLGSTPAAVKMRFENIRDQYRKYKVAVSKASALPRSGSAPKVSRLPKPYKYLAEAAFLDVVLKMEPTVESMESPDSSECEEDDLEPTDSVSSAGVKSTSASSETKKRKRKHNEQDFTNVLTGAVKSIDRLSGSFIASRKSEMPDETMDDDWLFARRLYLAMKKIPEGRKKAALKHKIEGDVMNAEYESSDSQETVRSDSITSQLPANHGWFNWRMNYYRPNQMTVPMHLTSINPTGHMLSSQMASPINMPPPMTPPTGTRSEFPYTADQPLYNIPHDDAAGN